MAGVHTPMPGVRDDIAFVVATVLSRPASSTETVEPGRADTVASWTMLDAGGAVGGEGIRTADDNAADIAGLDGTGGGVDRAPLTPAFFPARTGVDATAQ